MRKSEGMCQWIGGGEVGEEWSFGKVVEVDMFLLRRYQGMRGC